MKLEVITGSMYSGKTTALIEKIEQLKKEGKEVVALKPIRDTRYSKHDIVTHSGIRTKGLSIDNADEVWEFVEDADVIAIDEAQFFDWEFAETVNEIANQGTHVIVAGLDLDFKGKPFGIIPELMALADVVIKKQADCSVCGGIASRNQRLVNGKPAKESDPIVVVSEEITYEPRCRMHHEIKKDV